MNKEKGLWYYIRNYKYNSYFLKSFSIIMALVVLPVAAIGWLFYDNATKFMKNEINMTSVSYLSTTRDNIDMIVKEVDLLANKLSLNSNVQSIALTMSLFNSLDNPYSKANELFSMFTLVYKYIDSIYIYSENFNMVFSNTENTDIEHFSDKNWFDAYKNRKDAKTAFISRRKDGFYPFYISAIKPISTDLNNALGAIIINLDVEQLGEIVKSKDSPQIGNTYIIDEQGNVLYSQKRELITTNVSQSEYFKQILQQKVGYVGTMTLDDEKFVVSVLESNHFGWKFVSTIPLTYYEEKVTQMRYFIFNMILLCGIVAIVASLFISTKSFQPVRNILSILDEHEINHENNAGSDEIKFITGNILKTMQQNYQMQGELAHKLMLLNRAQIAALQAQINPHFIYNTLETINWMALELTNSENKVSYMVSTLAELFRLSMDMRSYVLNINEEINCAKLYMSLLEVRYRNKFTLVWDIDDEVLEYKIVKLCLQPILENAVYHGIKPKRTKGKIVIACNFDGEDILLKVSDDGIGMPDEKVRRLNEEMEDIYALPSEHIGIRNVNQRIKLIFGSDYGVRVESSPSYGTVVSVRIPRLKEIQ